MRDEKNSTENIEELNKVIEDLIKPEENTEPPAKPLEENKAPIKVESNQLMLPSKKEFLKEDPLLKGILNDEGVFDLLDTVLAELAEESTSLKYERIKKELNNEATDRLSLRRSNILKMISDALIQKRNLALNDFINLKSPQWQIVFEQLMKRINQTFTELSYSSEQIELFFQKLQNNLEGFEETTEQRLKESVFKVN